MPPHGCPPPNPSFSFAVSVIRVDFTGVDETPSDPLEDGDFAPAIVAVLAELSDCKVANVLSHAVQCWVPPWWASNC